jgi:hypothetical protein
VLLIGTYAELKNRNMDIAAVTKTGKKKKRFQIMAHYVMIYFGVSEENWVLSGVAILISYQWKHKIIDYSWISRGMFKFRVKLMKEVFNIFGTYAPIEGKDAETPEIMKCFKEVWIRLLAKRELQCKIWKPSIVWTRWKRRGTSQ